MPGELHTLHVDMHVFYSPQGLTQSDNRGKRFRPAKARYLAHFSQKNSTNSKMMFGKRLFSLRCAPKIFDEHKLDPQGLL